MEVLQDLPKTNDSGKVSCRTNNKYDCSSRGFPWQCHSYGSASTVNTLMPEKESAGRNAVYLC